MNSKVVAALPVPLPPSEEQREIVDTYASVEGRIEREGLFLGGLSNAKAALMSVLLTGEVRVKPDEEAA